jgi:Uncharacterized conserved protein
MKTWLESDGKAANKALAEAAGVTESRIRKWKSEDGWKAALEEQRSKRKRGAPPGNKNAIGSGAPKRNENALTHGAYKTVYFDELSEDEKALIESIDLDTQANMLRELQTLVAKENDLKKRIAALELTSPETLYVDKVVEMLVPQAKKEGEEGEGRKRSTREPPLKTAMQTIIKASPFDRALKLRGELDKTHGRIIRLLDSVKAYELESRRLLLEERKYRLAKQKLNGEFEIDPATGEINDDYDPEDGEEGPI